MTEQATTSGVLNIDKPVGLTSHDVVARIRRLLQPVTAAAGSRRSGTTHSLKPRIGHTGTLDPFATGVLLVAVGKATRLIEYTHTLPKTYEATVTLGATSDTDDVTGTITPNARAAAPSRGALDTALDSFRGTITQTPPSYSAVKIAGERSYKKARRGEQPTLPPRTITIHKLAVTHYAYPNLGLRIVCSTGTYIRALARDIGSALGTGAYAHTLRRTAIGPFDIVSTIQLDELSTDTYTGALKRVETLVAHLPHLTLPPESVAQLIDGKRIPWQKPAPTGPLALRDTGKKLIGIGHFDPTTSLLRPDKILVS